jgi:protein O-GlcNAc transferase
LLPDFVDGAYNLGLAYFRQGELRSALTALRDVVGRQPKHADAWLHIGEIYLQLGQPRRAQAALKVAAQEMAYGGAFNAQTGERLLAEGRFAEALQLYYQRVRRFPKSLEDYSALIDASVAQKQWQMAIWASVEATRLRPRQQALRRRFVDILVMAGMLDRARGEAQRSVATWPQSPDAWAALGSVNYRLGDLDAAQDNFNHALALTPDHPGALVGLARTYFARGKPLAVLLCWSLAPARPPKVRLWTPSSVWPTGSWAV